MESGKKSGKDKKTAILLGVVMVLAIAVIAQGAMLFQARCQMGGVKGGALSGQICPFVKRDTKPSVPKAGFTPLAGRTQAASMWGDDFLSGDWDPFQEMDRMQKGINRMFGRTMRRMMADPGHGASLAHSMEFQPDIDIAEAGGYYVINYDLPGMDKDKISVDIHDHVLTVSGQRDVTGEKEGDGFYRMERSFGSFSRSVPLPYDADITDVQASYEKGVLKIRIKKIQEAEIRSSASKPVPVA